MFFLDFLSFNPKITVFAQWTCQAFHYCCNVFHQNLRDKVSSGDIGKFKCIWWHVFTNVKLIQSNKYHLKIS